MNLQKLLITAIRASIKGGLVIMDIYDSDFSVFRKEDNTPLTLADKNCNNIIEQMLEKTGIPILSEEGRGVSYQERKNWEYFWLIDPLDGTKEFVKRNGEFTVNIALIYKDYPVIGVIYVPAKKDLYFALEELGSFKINLLDIQDDYTFISLSQLISFSVKLPLKNTRQIFTIVGSRSHMSLETKEVFKEMKKKHGKIEVIEVGSSLKICMVAEGRADLYVRYAPTMEWDTAAGDAILRYAGFNLIAFKTSKSLVYNKEKLVNPWFLAK